MFRDLKEYQEIAKLYAEKVSKTNDLDENRNTRSSELAAKRLADKPKTREEVGLKPIEKKPFVGSRSRFNTKKITGKDPMTGGPVDNYATGSVVVNPDDGSKPVRKVGVYAHLELKGGSLSEAQLKMIKMYDDKKKKEEEELSKKDKVSSMMTKDSVKKEDEKEEEKPDMRSKYAMINIIKNKLRAAGQRDPMVMAVDACEQTTVTNDGSKLSPKHSPGGELSQYEKDGTKKKKKYDPGFDPEKASETTGP